MFRVCFGTVATVGQASWLEKPRQVCIYHFDNLSAMRPVQVRMNFTIPDTDPGDERYIHLDP